MKLPFCEHGDEPSASIVTESILIW